MTVYISFNWPAGFFTASVGMINVDEKDSLFNLGLISSENPKLVRWNSKEPVSADIAESNDFRIQGERGCNIVLQVLGKNAEVKKQVVIDTAKEWPLGARGGTMIEWKKTY